MRNCSVSAHYPFDMPTILTVAGTRPEAIKVAPLLAELRNHPALRSLYCVTAQHRQMLDQVHEWFGLIPDVDLSLMEPGQTLAGFAAKAFAGLAQVFSEHRPDCVVVQGDTTTAMMAALAAAYQKIPVAHIEAGLRTGEFFNPFPEEINRRVISAATRFHFAPTLTAAETLRREGIPQEWIHVTGNTVIDALRLTAARDVTLTVSLPDGPIVLVTAHRRESFGEPFENICLALRRIADENPEAALVYPVHLNPNVREPVQRLLSNHPRIFLIEPLRYEQFVHLMKRARLILTDSGGVQEEAPFLGIPVLVMRDTTERPEAVLAGASKLVGTGKDRIAAEACRLLQDEAARLAMTHAGNPYGDGYAARRIAEVLASELV